jgi:hypothetical protein
MPPSIDSGQLKRTLAMTPTQRIEAMCELSRTVSPLSLLRSAPDDR